jgi:hypothetical protein
VACDDEVLLGNRIELRSTKDDLWVCEIEVFGEVWRGDMNGVSAVSTRWTRSTYLTDASRGDITTSGVEDTPFRSNAGLIP